MFEYFFSLSLKIEREVGYMEQKVMGSNPPSLMIERRSGVYPELDIIVAFPIIGTECPDYFTDK